LSREINSNSSGPELGVALLIAKTA
jgi:hypothetical protein